MVTGRDRADVGGGDSDSSEQHLRESYRALVRELLALPGGEGPRIVLVVGAVHGEGVTTVAAELAAGLLQVDQGKVLLMDADPRIAAQLGRGRHAPASDGSVIGRTGDGEARGEPDRLLVRAAGSLDSQAAGARHGPSGAGARATTSRSLVPRGEAGGRALVGTQTLTLGPMDLVNKPHLERVLSEVDDDIEWIIIDGPPVTVYAEAAALTPLADATLLVVRAESTRWEVADRAKRIIQASGGHLLGAVLYDRRHHIPDSVYRLL